MRTGFLIFALTTIPAFGSAQALGIAAPYAAYSLGDGALGFNQIDGSVAVAGNLATFGTSIDGAGLVVGKDWNAVGTAVSGSATTGGKANLDCSAVGGTLTEGYGFDFQTSVFQRSSNRWAEILSNGSVSGDGEGLCLTGSSKGLNVFTLTATQAAAEHITIQTPVASTVVINIVGQNVNLAPESLSVEGADTAHLLWNLNQTQTVTLGNLRGTLVAPKASITQLGAVDGQLVAGTYFSVGDVHYDPFLGVLPGSGPPLPVPEPATLVTLGAGFLGLAKRRRAGKAV